MAIGVEVREISEAEAAGMVQTGRMATGPLYLIILAVREKIELLTGRNPAIELGMLDETTALAYVSTDDFPGTAIYAVKVTQDG